MFNPQKVTQDQIKRMYEMLTDDNLEWPFLEIMQETVAHRCNFCMGYFPNHENGCKLGTLLKELEAQR